MREYTSKEQDTNMTLQEFQQSIKNLKDFFKELEGLESILKILSPSGTGVCEIGHKFIDDYISLLELALGDNSNIVSWFVFENEFGNRKLSCHIFDKEYKIRNEKDLYNFLKKMK